MESFARAVEIVLGESVLRDAAGYWPEPSLWTPAVRRCGYLHARQAVGVELLQARTA